MLSNSLLLKVYYRPVQSYNKGKLGEFNDRKFFKEPNRKYQEETSK